MDDINILVTCVGRRVELVNLFKKAANRLGICSSIVATDSSYLAPGLFAADKKYVVSGLEHPNYIQEIIRICVNENIKLLVPTIDTELLLLAKYKNQIEDATGAKVLISDRKIIEVCRNKFNTHRYLTDNNFLAPKLYSSEEIRNGTVQYPLFIKPVDGSSSVNTFKVNNDSELNFFTNYIQNSMVQEFVAGEEYTVDVFLDFDSNIISIAPRLRMSTRAGEILKGKITKDKEIIKTISELMAILKPIGHITVQCMKTNAGLKFIEINPRFSGGAPMSILAGADSCENLYRILRGEKLCYNESYKDGLLFLRFDNSICLDENLEVTDNG